jgi:hypothetical protein
MAKASGQAENDVRTNKNAGAGPRRSVVIATDQPRFSIGT